jgi:hypothetical protein
MTIDIAKYNTRIPDPGEITDKGRRYLQLVVIFLSPKGTSNILLYLTLSKYIHLQTPKSTILMS